MKVLIIMSLLSLLPAFAQDKLPTAQHVNVGEYVGKWYAISALPQFFTRKCVAQTAEYQVRNANSITVLNTCIKNNGSETTIEGQAVVANPETNAELIVTFNNFWTKLFRVKGDYNIIKLDESYAHVLVGSNNRKSLWILSRTPYMDESTKKAYLDYAKKLNFDISKMVDSKF
ncbi:MAG: lipocalin family protein [Bdellovibrionales bacterium]|nr:lipocalin family protein [Bdellovibrionales bacterium]